MLSIEAETHEALETWNREFLFHASSPLYRFSETMDRRHADTIDEMDFPKTWRALDITVDVEAKAKELAV